MCIDLGLISTLLFAPHLTIHSFANVNWSRRFTSSPSTLLPHCDYLHTLPLCPITRKYVLNPKCTHMYKYPERIDIASPHTRLAYLTSRNFGLHQQRCPSEICHLAIRLRCASVDFAPPVFAPLPRHAPPLWMGITCTMSDDVVAPPNPHRTPNPSAVDSSAQVCKYRVRVYRTNNASRKARHIENVAAPRGFWAVNMGGGRVAIGLKGTGYPSGRVRQDEERETY